PEATVPKPHAGVIAAAAFFAVEVWTARGLITHYVLFFIDLATRGVEIAGVTTSPDAKLVARNLTDQVDEFLRGKRFVALDRDSKFSEQFHAILNAAGLHSLPTSRRAPTMNSFADRFVLTSKGECLYRLILFGERMLHWALTSFVAHYQQKRNQQSLDNQLI